MIKLLLKFADESREFELADPVVTIGRSSENLIMIDDKKASRKHAEIQKSEQGYRVNDLGSGNGTRVNGSEVNTALLAKGDEIRIGLTTIYVLDLDAPSAVPAAPAALPAAVAAAPVAAPPPALAPAPAVPEAAPAPAAPPPERPPEARHKITHRSTYALKSSSGGRWVATAATLIVLGSAGYAAYYYWPQLTAAGKGGAEAAAPPKVNSTAKEAAVALKEIRSKVDSANPMTEPLVREAHDLAAKFGQADPAFAAVAEQASLKWAEQIKKMKFGDVEKLVQAALQEKRFGDATDALKPLRDGADADRVASLLTRVDTEAKADYSMVDGWGKKLVDRKQYVGAIEHYRENAPRFRGTVYYKSLDGKAKGLEELARIESEVASKPKEAPAPPDTSIAKVTKEPAAEPPKEAPKPAMPEKPKPPDAEKPKPAPPTKPKEPPKMEAPKPKPEPPKPPPPPPPPAKPKEPITTKGFKKPDVLCNCSKVVKGVYCLKCDRMLEPDDIRRNVCKRCEEPPKKIDLCLKRYFMVDGKPDTISNKPFTYGGKLYDIPMEDRARIIYFCTGCEEVGDTQNEVKHKPDCPNKNVIKVCTKSGTPPHVP